MFQLLTTGYSDQLIAFSMDELSGKLNQIGNSKIGTQASYGAVGNHSDIYFVHEVDNFEDKIKDSGAISRWKFGPQGSVTDTKETVSSKDKSPCHITLFYQFGLLLVSNYVGSFASYSFDTQTGKILDLVYEEKYKGNGNPLNQGRQASSHAHGAFVFKNFVYVVDLGEDKIWHYKASINSGKANLVGSGSTDVPKGSGPRHLVISESKQRAFLVTELNAKLHVFKISEETGSLEEIQKLEVLSDEFKETVAKNPIDQYPSAIALHPNGNWLYVSNRGLGAIIQFDVSGDKTVRGKTILTTGNWPRDFKIRPDGKFLVAAQQMNNNVEVYSIDQTDGHLEKVDMANSQNSPTFVTFY